MKLHLSTHTPDGYGDQACGACDGSGYGEDEYEPNRVVRCGVCHGTGVDMVQHRR